MSDSLPAGSPERSKSDRRRFPRRLTDRVWDVRRRFLYGVPALVLSVLGLLGIWAFWLEPDRLVVRRTPILVADWPAELRPLRVACLSDIHGGAPYIDREKLRTAVALTNSQEPDVIALLGDYIILGVLGGRPMSPEELADGLRGLEAPLGVYAVLGNHDWWYDGPRMRRALEDVGYRVLEDEATTVSVDGRTIALVGLGDEWTRRPDVEKVMEAVPAGTPTIVLTHGPDLFPRLPPIAGVTLAGHTHGGQVRLPLMGAPIVPSRYRQRYVSGHVRAGEQHLFVTSGVGTSVLPVRFRVPPEVAVVEISAEARR